MSVPHLPNGRDGPDGVLAGRSGVLLVWGGWSLFFLLLYAQSIARFATQDPDDYMRLLEVRDLLAGQSWFDVTQYRMNPPEGAAMHWSRLVDLPLALLMVLFDPFMSQRAADLAAMSIVPLVQLGAVMALVVRIARILGMENRQALIAAAIVPLFPFLLTIYAPLRIDHHGWQGVAAAACGYLLLRTGERNAAVMAGSVAALWLSISLEGLPMVVILAGIYGLRFGLRGDRSVAPFLAGLAGASWLSFIATRPWSEFASPYCDAIGWPHLTGFTLAAVLTALLVRIPALGGVVARMAGLAAVGAAAAATVLLPLGVCAVNPFAGLDPVMAQYWHGMILEGLPFTAQPVSIKVMLLWVPAIVLVALRLAWHCEDGPLLDRKWVMLALYTLGACLVSLLVLREAVNAQILAVPFSAAIVARLLPAARRIPGLLLRTAATCGLITLATPSLASGAIKPLDNILAPPARLVVRGDRSTNEPCLLDRLTSLPQANIFATLDMGPQILARTDHTVVASGYHRNMVAMRDVLEAFSGDPDKAEAIVRARSGDYVMLCLTDGEADVFRHRRPDNLTSDLIAGKVPAWLEPLPDFESGSLRVYRVR